jgi:hypothetical protein
MARRESRASFEREFLRIRRQVRILGNERQDRMLGEIEHHMARMRMLLDPDEFARLEARFREGIRRIADEMRRRGRRPPDDGGMPALVEPPRGPTPLAGGAAAPLEFD